MNRPSARIEVWPNIMTRPATVATTDVNGSIDSGPK
jgi:hypothetical protein